MDDGFDLRTAPIDPRRMVSDVIPRSEDYDMDMAQLRIEAGILRNKLIFRFKDVNTDMFVTVIEETEGRRVMVGYGVSHDVLPDKE